MKRWIVGALAGACIGVAVYLVLTNNNPPQSAPPEPPAVSAAPAPPTAPVVLDQVIEVTDLDPLLDPPEKTVAGMPFEPDSKTLPVSTPAGPDRIPPAID